MELGCDPRGYSRAGYDTTIWYCAIALGRPSMELNRLREVCTLYCFKPNLHDIFSTKYVLIQHLHYDLS